MWKLIDRLRDEPEPQRRRFALIVAFSITGLVFLAWAMSFSAGINIYTRAPQIASTSPLAALGDVLKQGGDFIKDFKGFISETRTIFTATSTATSTSE